MAKAFSLYTKDTPSFSMKQVEQRVVLNYVSIQANSNKFYIIEFHEGLGEFPYRIQTEYGRLGSSSRRQDRYYETRLEAKREFERILSAKRTKGYEIIIIDEEWDEPSFKPFRTSFQRETMHSNSPSSSISINTVLGKLSEIQLHRGIQILYEIEEKIKNGSPELVRLSNQFYSVIPIVFGSQINRNCLLDSMEKVTEKRERLNQMISGSHN